MRMGLLVMALLRHKLPPNHQLSPNLPCLPQSIDRLFRSLKDCLQLGITTFIQGKQDSRFATVTGVRCEHLNVSTAAAMDNERNVSLPQRELTSPKLT